MAQAPATADLPFHAEGDLPLTITPGDDPDVDALCAWLTAHPDWVQDELTRHGALRFRGFAVTGPEAFERIARAVDPELKNDYLGTSPRDAVTDYVFNASELPPYFPIPQHCEMTFCANPPRRIFFCCLEEPRKGGGETPLCDFRNVWRDLDPEVRNRFEAGGLRIVRNYEGPKDGEPEDPTQLKPWPDMFHTTDREEVEAQCRAEGFEAEWLPGDRLRLWSTQPVRRDHPVTGEPVWHNHTTTFHISTAEAELRRVAAFRPDERHRGLAGMAAELAKKQRQRASNEHGMHCMHLDGSEIREEDVEHLRDVVWRHMVIEPWRLGDVVAVDNHSTSHGRLPYEGPRRVVVCWA